MQEHALTQGLTFNEDDMQTIRQGTLTEAQCKKLRKLQGRSNRITLGCGLFALLGVGCFASIVLIPVLSQPLTPLGKIVIGVGGILVLVLLLGVVSAIGLQVVRFNQDLAERRVESVTGATQIIAISSSGSSQHYLEVNGLRFVTVPWLYQLDKPGEVYRIFYVPHSKVLVTAEPVRH